ncbi:MAG: TraB/GumN family protein [Bacteroidia bacterium]
MARITTNFARFFTLVLFAFIAFLSAHSQNQTAIHDLQHPWVKVQPTQSILWQISRPGDSHVSYIYAILHLVPQDNFFIPEGINPLIRKSDKLVMEVDPREYDPDYLYRGAVPFDSTLDLIFDKKTFARVEAFVEDTLSPASAKKLLNRYSPNALARQVVADYCLGFREGEYPVDYESYLTGAISLPLKTLNTGWTRASWLQDEFSIREQADNLLYVIREKDSLCHLYDEYLMAYRRQDLDALSMLAQEVPDLGWNAHDFVEARNRDWIKSLEWQLEKDNLFMVIHAVQLPGEFGLLHLLRKAGFEVNPVELYIPPYKNDPKRYATPRR